MLRLFDIHHPDIHHLRHSSPKFWRHLDIPDAIPTTTTPPRPSKMPQAKASSCTLRVTAKDAEGHNVYLYELSSGIVRSETERYLLPYEDIIIHREIRKKLLQVASFHFFWKYHWPDQIQPLLGFDFTWKLSPTVLHTLHTALNKDDILFHIKHLQKQSSKNVDSPTSVTPSALFKEN